MADQQQEQQQQPTFKLNAWKDVISNSTPSEARQWFKDNFPNATGFSIFRAKYKYPDEMKPLLFMNENLNVGYLQDQYMDPGVRKVGFGSCVISGPSETAKFVLTHLWLFSTEDIPQLFQESNLYPNFDFEKLDFNKPEDQEFILDMLTKDVNEQVRGLPGTILSKETYK